MYTVFIFIPDAALQEESEEQNQSSSYASFPLRDLLSKSSGG